MKTIKPIIIFLAILMSLAPIWASWALDVCTQPHQVASVAISSATTTQIVGVTTIGTNSRRIVVCGYDFTVTGTTPTYQFDEGTGTACATNGTTLSGAYAPTAGTKASFGDGSASIIQTDPGKELCIISGGTPGIQGILDYVVVP